jgi:tetratricopeptide (TPR) repeat protein
MKWMATIILGGLFTGLVLAQEKDPAKTATPPSGNQPAVEKKATKTLKLVDVPSPQQPVADSSEEGLDYFAITQSRDPEERIKLIEEFLSAYPKSQRATQLHQMAAYHYQETNNLDKMIQHGDAVLAVSQNDPTFLCTMALAYQAKDDYDKTISLAEGALKILGNTTMPAQAKPDAWNAEKKRYESMAHTAAGSGYLGQYQVAVSRAKEKKSGSPAPVAGSTGTANATPGESAKASPDKTNQPATPGADPVLKESLDKAQDHLQKAVALLPTYDLPNFQLGLLFSYRNNAAQAMDAFARTVLLGSSFAQAARQNLEYLYKFTHKNSLEGLDQYIAKVKEDLKAQMPQPKPEEKESESSASQP